jgi:hypothetical protein
MEGAETTTAMSAFPAFGRLTLDEIMALQPLLLTHEAKSTLNPGYVPGLYDWDGRLAFCELHKNVICSWNDPFQAGRPCVHVAGTHDLEDTALSVFRYQQAASQPVGLSEVDQTQANLLRESHMVRVVHEPGEDEYVLSTRMHAELIDRHIRSEARAVRHFQRAYGEHTRVGELDLTQPESVAQVLAAMRQWQRPFMNKNNDPEGIESRYVSLFITNAHHLPTRNITLWHRNAIIGFGFYDLAPQHSAAIFHSLKVDYAYNHIFDFGIHSLAARLSDEGVGFMNIEETRGHLGLKYKKDSLQPVELLRRYRVVPCGSRRTMH